MFLQFRGHNRIATERMRARRRRSARILRRMRVMARNTIHSSYRTHFPLPISAGPAMRSRFPIAISRPVATPAQRCAFREFQLPAVTRLEQLQICIVVTVVAKVVAIVTSMTHDDVRVFLRNNQVVFVVKSQSRCLIFLVTRIAIKIRKVGFSGRQLAIRNSGCRVTGYRTVH